MACEIKLLIVSPTVELGRLPPEELLPILPPISSSAGPPSSDAEMTVVGYKECSGFVDELVGPPIRIGSCKLPKVWVGDGLPSIPRRIYTYMTRFCSGSLLTLRNCN